MMMIAAWIYIFAIPVVFTCFLAHAAYCAGKRGENFAGDLAAEAFAEAFAVAATWPLLALIVPCYYVFKFFCEFFVRLGQKHRNPFNTLPPL